MTTRERFNNLLHFKPVDRLPALHFGYWTELLAEWGEQGYIPKNYAHDLKRGNECDLALDKRFGWEFNMGDTVSANYRLSPMFPYRVLEELPDGSRKVQNKWGAIEIVMPGVESIPCDCDYVLKDRKSFEEVYLPRMQFTADRIPSDFAEKMKQRDPDKPLGLMAGSLVGQIRDMASLVGFSYLLYDEDVTLMRDIVDAYAELQYQVVKATLETGVKFDFMHYWEDICFVGGPLLDPGLFRDLTFKHYQKRNELAKQYGIDIVTLDCDGVTDLLQPTWIDSGVNVLFPIEVGTWGDQFAKAREKHGRRQLGVGGMDKHVLLKDRAAVDEEIGRLQKLVDMGGFIPCPDHVLLPGTKFELVQYYVEKIKKMKVPQFEE